MRNSVLALILSVLAVAPAEAGPFMRMLKAKQAADAARAAQAEAEAPAAPELPQAAIEAAPAPSAAELAAAGPEASPAPPLDAADLFHPVNVQRNEALQRLADAGGREILRQAGLMLWRFSREGGDYSLTVSFFDGARPERLRDYVKAKGPEVAATLAAALGTGADNVRLRSRSSDSCCGSGCASCLRSKDQASPYWTGRPPHRHEPR